MPIEAEIEVMRNAVESRMQTFWPAGGGGPDTPIIYDGDPDEMQTADHVHLNMLFSDSEQSLDGVTIRRTGVIMIRVYTKTGLGGNASDLLIGEALKIFESKEFGGILCFSANLTRVGSVGEWYQVNVAFPFWYDTISP